MDAKAKIVRWECRPLNWEVQYQQRDDGEWVKFTDHEAALAELRNEKDGVLRQYAENVSAEMEGLLIQLRNAEQRNTTLLTGLEALAGEWEVRGLELESVGESEADFINAAALTSAANRLRRTLASAGLEGKDVPR